MLLVKPDSFYLIGTERQKKIMTNIFLRIRKNYLTPHIWNIRILPFKATIFRRAYGIVAPRPTPAPMEMHINLLSTSMRGIKTLQLSLNFPGRLVTVAKIPAQTFLLSLCFQGKFSDYCKNPRLNNLITPGIQGRKQTLCILPKTSSNPSSPVQTGLTFLPFTSLKLDK